MQRCPGFTSKTCAFRRKTDYVGAFAERFDCELGRLSPIVQISVANTAETSVANNSEFRDGHFDNTEFVARGSRGLRDRYSLQYDNGTIHPTETFFSFALSPRLISSQTTIKRISRIIDRKSPPTYVFDHRKRKFSKNIAQNRLLERRGFLNDPSNMTKNTKMCSIRIICTLNVIHICAYMFGKKQKNHYNLGGLLKFAWYW